MSVDRIFLRQAAKSIKESPEYLPYSKVRIIVGEDSDGMQLVYEAGDDTFRTLEIQNPWGTQEIANAILSKIQGYAYKPYKVDGAILNPAAEIGDAVSVGGVYSFISSQDTMFSARMTANIAAPEDGDIDHEYPYEVSEYKEINRKINEAKASFTVELGRIEASLEDYQTKEGMSDYVEKTSLNTSIGQYIDTTTGSAKITSAVSGTYQTINGMSEYVQKINLNTSINQYIDSNTGKAQIDSIVSGTYQKKSDMSGYVQTTSLNASIKQYINTTDGKAQIVSAVSGTYQRKDAMGNYVTSSTLNSSIAQYVESTSGKAKIVAAVSGTYQTINGMSGYAKTTDVNASIEAYVDTTAGKAKITSAVSATYQKKADMSGYVKTASLNNSITQYVESTTGKNKIIAAVSGKYAGKSYESRVEVSESKIGWLIKSGTDASNFTMTDRAISLVSSTIDLRGYVTFTSLTTRGSSSINGDNITTGTVNAARINASELKIEKIYSPKSNNLLLFCSDTSSTNTVLHLGAGDNIADVKKIMIQAQTQVMLGAYSTDGLIFDTSNHIFYPYSVATSLIWSLGKATNPFSEIVVDKITFCPNRSASNAASLTDSYDSGKHTLEPSADKVISIGTSSKRLKTVAADVVDANTIGGGAETLAFSTKRGSTTQTLTMVQASGSLSFTPSTDNYFELGTSSYKFKDIYLQSAHIGDSTSSAKISFFGATAIAKQTLSTSSTNMNYTSATSSNYLTILNNLCGILKNKYGLIG